MTYNIVQRFDFLYFSLPNYADLTVRFITYTMNGSKIPFNKQIERKLFQMGLEFTKKDTKHIFQVKPYIFFDWLQMSEVDAFSSVTLISN